MRKLVKAGLIVPMILLVALATFGLGLAAEGDLNERDLNGQNTLNEREGTSADARARTRGTDSEEQIQNASDESGSVQVFDDSERGRGSDRNSTADSRAARRGRQAPRASNGSSFDEESWWWWNNGKGGGNDEDEDEDDDEDMSPSNW